MQIHIRYDISKGETRADAEELAESITEVTNVPIYEIPVDKEE